MRLGSHPFEGSGDGEARRAQGALARQIEAARRGQTDRDPADTARHVDDLLAYAAELAVGVL
jgi:hypothetical protein